MNIAAVLMMVMVLQQAHAQTSTYGEELSDAKAVKATNLEKAMDGKEVTAL